MLDSLIATTVTVVGTLIVVYPIAYFARRWKEKLHG
jgi:ABC-type spermidine/putrescine transport system permease subunit I